MLSLTRLGIDSACEGGNWGSLTGVRNSVKAAGIELSQGRQNGGSVRCRDLARLHRTKDLPGGFLCACVYSPAGV